MGDRLPLIWTVRPDDFGHSPDAVVDPCLRYRQSSRGVLLGSLECPTRLETLRARAPGNAVATAPKPMTTKLMVGSTYTTLATYYRHLELPMSSTWTGTDLYCSSGIGVGTRS